VRTDEIVLGQEPPEIPALVVYAAGDAALTNLGGATEPSVGQRVVLAIAYLMLDSAGADGKRDAGYTLAAVRRSLARLNAEPQSVRTRNVSLLVDIDDLTERRIGATKGRCALAGVVLARCRMEDLHDDAAFQQAGVGPVASVIVSPSAPTLAVSGTQQMTATPKDASGNPIIGRTVLWLSGNPDVATVSDTGLVSAIASGTADVVALVDGVSGSAVVTVGAAPGVQEVTVSPTSGTLPAYGSFSFAVAPLDASGNVMQGKTVTAVSSDPTIATVSVSGYVITVQDVSGRGAICTVTATVDGVHSAPVLVTAGDLVAALNAAGPSVARWYSARFADRITASAGVASAIAPALAILPGGNLTASGTAQPAYDPIAGTLTFNQTSSTVFGALAADLDLSQPLALVLVGALDGALNSGGYFASIVNSAANQWFALSSPPGSDDGDIVTNTWNGAVQIAADSTVLRSATRRLAMATSTPSGPLTIQVPNVAARSATGNAHTSGSCRLVLGNFKNGGTSFGKMVFSDCLVLAGVLTAAQIALLDQVATVIGAVFV